MSFLKSILKPFVEFKEGEAEPAKDIEKQVVKASNQSETETANYVPPNDIDRSPSFTSTPPAGSAAANPEYKKYFENLVEEANAKNPLFQGTDFKEFIDSKIDVEAIADETTRYKTAFNVLKRTGLTKERLVTTGREYINLIDRDLKGFEAAYQQHYKTDVEQKEQLLQKKAEELKALTEKIATLDQEMKKMSQEIVQSKDKLVSNKNSFVLAGEGKKKEIEAELQKIAQYF